ncbi:MAG: S8 family serine peptidase [Planctomycetota bacterium]
MSGGLRKRSLVGAKSRTAAQLSIERLEPRCLLAADLADLTGRNYVADEVLVQFAPNATPFQMEQARVAVGGQTREVIQTTTMQESGAGRLERLGLGQGLDVSAAIAKLGRSKAVVFVEPNYIYQTAAVSNDTYYTNGSLWGVYSDDSPATGPSGTTNQFGTQAEKVWASNITGSSSVYVGVIDEGIQITHPELNPNVWVNPYETPGDGIDNDGNGYIDDINGWDFANNDASVYDSTADDHGTHVAGTIGAKGGNGAGLAGMNWTVKMISAKFLGANGGTVANAVKAVDYLTDLKTRHGINIVASNNSWGGGGYSQALHDAIIRHANQNILFVAAAGNSAANNNSGGFYPANYDTSIGTSTQAAASYDGVIAVASITSAGGLSSFSNYGSTTVDLGAPGSGIVSTVPSNTYATYDGTSMATPHVTGAVALYASAQSGTVTAQSIRQAILGSTTPTASLSGKTVTGGRLNIYAALNLNNDQTPPQISGISVQPASTTAVITWTTNEAASTEVIYGTDQNNLNLTFNDANLTLTHQAGLSGLAKLTTYYFRVRSRDAAGNVTTAAVQSFTTTDTPAILFVDDDFGETYERFFVNALQANGRSFDTWNVQAVGQTPSSAVMGNYRLVIWNAGYAFQGNGAGLASGEQAAIANYLDAGGRIFISGQDVLYTGVSTSFRQNYLKVASFTDDVQNGNHTATGVSGNPISSDLSLVMTAPSDFPSIYADALTPAAGATGLLNHGVGSAASPFSAVSFRGNLAAGGFGMVFTTVPFEAISTTAANPNNQNSVMLRVINYLLPETVVTAPSPNNKTTEAAGAVSFTVKLNTPPTANVVIPVSSSDTTEGTVNVSSLTFTPTNWSVAQTVTITGVDDQLDDGDIAYSILLGVISSTDSGFSGMNPADISLINLDNDFFPDIAVTAPTSVVEGTTGSKTVNFTVSLSAASDQTVSIDYATTTNGYSTPATPGNDFTPVSGRLDFTPGQTSKTVSVTINTDRLVELDETFGLLLSNPQRGYLVGGLADVVISDDDAWSLNKEIDFGTEISPVKTGTVAVGALPFTTAKGIGWNAGVGNVQIVDRGLGTSGLRDIALTTNSSFAFNVPNGSYIVRLTFGDSIKAHDQMRTTIEGSNKPVVNTAVNEFITRVYTVNVTDGQLNLTFTDMGGADSQVALAGIAFGRR